MFGKLSTSPMPFLKRYSTYLLLFLAGISGFIMLKTSWHLYQTKKAISAAAYKKAATKTDTTVKELTTFIELLKTRVTSFAEQLNTKKLSKKEIEQELLKKMPELSGIGVAFVPAFSPTDTLWAPYCVEKDGKKELTELKYDYTQPDIAWYNSVLHNGPRFTHPYISDPYTSIMLEYGAPFYHDGKPAGIVFANQTRSHIHHVLSTLFLGQTGYWFILADDGTFLVHPDNQLIAQKTTLKEYAQTNNNYGLKELEHRLHNAHNGSLTYTNELTDASSLLFFKKIPETGWTVCGVFDRNELFFNYTDLKNTHLKLSLALLALLLSLLFWFILRSTHTVLTLWLISFGCACILASEIGYIWHLAARYPRQDTTVRSIKSKLDLYTFLDNVTKNLKHTKKESPPHVHEKLVSEPSSHVLNYLTYRYSSGIFIPTGIFINHLALRNPTQLEVSFLLWQRYTKKYLSLIEPGFILPQATDTFIRHLSTTEEGNTKTIVWQVKCLLSQAFDYTNYPFDIKNLQIQIWPLDFAKQCILVPDLDAYRIINPRSRAGIAPEARITGFIPQKSYFGYQTTNYKTNFGIYQYGDFGIYQETDKALLPNLYYTVTAQRHLIDTMLADLLPIAVIMVLLFAILLTSVGQGYAVLGSCASVFFGLVLAHVRFRAKIPSSELVYFEYMYLIMYAAIVYTVIAALLYLLPISIPIIQERKNLMAKLFYWPIVLGSILLVTLAYLA